MNDKTHDETSPEQNEDQAAELAALQQMAEEGESGQGQEQNEKKIDARIPTAALIRPAVDVVCAVIANRLPPPLVEEEKGALTDAYAALIDHYFPDFDFGPVLGAAIVTAAVFAPRWQARRAAEGEQQTGKGGQETTADG